MLNILYLKDIHLRTTRGFIVLFELYSLLSCIGRSGIALKVLSGVGVEGFGVSG